MTGVTHNVNASAGKRLRTLAQTVISSDLAQGPGTGQNQIILASAESSVDGTFDPASVAIVGGTGSGQCRRILEYKGSTRAATVNRNWKVAPDATSGYIIYADAGGSSTNEGLLRAASSNTAQLNVIASSTDGAYVGQTLWVVSGTGDDQSRLIIAYNGSTKTATIDGSWAVTPDTKDLWPNVLMRYRCAKVKAKDRLRMWIQHLVLNASDSVSLPRSSILIGTDYIFELAPLVDGAQQYLQSLLEIYQKGVRELVYFFPESSLAYVESIQKGKPNPDALKAALTVWKGNEHVPGEAEDPYYALCFKNTDPFTEEFEALAVKLFEPLMQHQIQVK